ncbi:phospho-N-acetylmuramoyl-pentapeptide-transferase [bacterium]|nr:MAG: phospho-N-acetylmuramoyl-pentapeptide-transferase [bacterium]
MKLQQVLAAVIIFIVALLVSIYLLHVIFAALFPSAGSWVTYGIPELLGLILAIVGAYLGWKWSGKARPADE